MTDVANGQVAMFAASITAALPMIQADPLRPLAVASPLRAAALPNIPTMAESGFQGIETAVIFGVVAPAGTPDTVVSRLNQEINRALKQPVAVADRPGVDPQIPERHRARVCQPAYG